jgi:hypothetical protein
VDELTVSRVTSGNSFLLRKAVTPSCPLCCVVWLSQLSYHIWGGHRFSSQGLSRRPVGCVFSWGSCPAWAAPEAKGTMRHLWATGFLEIAHNSESDCPDSVSCDAPPSQGNLGNQLPSLRSWASASVDSWKPPVPEVGPFSSVSSSCSLPSHDLGAKARIIRQDVCGQASRALGCRKGFPERQSTPPAFSQDQKSHPWSVLWVMGTQLTVQVCLGAGLISWTEVLSPKTTTSEASLPGLLGSPPPLSPTSSAFKLLCPWTCCLSCPGGLWARPRALTLAAFRPHTHLWNWLHLAVSCCLTDTILQVVSEGRPLRNRWASGDGAHCILPAVSWWSSYSRGWDLLWFPESLWGGLTEVVWVSNR